MTRALPASVRAAAIAVAPVPLPRARRRRRRRHYRPAETWAIRDELLAVVGRVPVLPQVLFARLRDTWGSVHQRRLWRALAWLVNRGKIVRVGDPFTLDGGYVRTRDGGAETEQDRRARERIERATARRRWS